MTITDVVQLVPVIGPGPAPPGQECPNDLLSYLDPSATPLQGALLGEGSKPLATYRHLGWVRSLMDRIVALVKGRV